MILVHDREAFERYLGHAYLESLLRSRRHSLETFEIAVACGWTSEQTDRYIETGKMPHEP